MLDALVDRQDATVAGAGEPAGAVQALQVGQDALVAVAGDEDAVDEVRARHVEQVRRDGLAAVLEQGVGLLAAEEVVNPVGSWSGPQVEGDAVHFSPVGGRQSGDGWHALRYSEGRAVRCSTPFGVPQGVPPIREPVFPDCGMRAGPINRSGWRRTRRRRHGLPTCRLAIARGLRPNRPPRGASLLVRGDGPSRPLFRWPSAAPLIYTPFTSFRHTTVRQHQGRTCHVDVHR